jgi:hypothetical protein
VTDPPDTDSSGFTRPFADILAAIQAGTVAAEAATALQAVVQAVREHGGKGLVRLDLKIEPMKGGGTALAVAGEVTFKAPRPEPPSAIFFSDDNGNLSRDDPRQQQIPGLRTVGGKDIDPDKIKEIK